MRTTFWARHAWISEVGPGAERMAENVRIEITDGRFSAVTPDRIPMPGEAQLAGVVLPGFANTHSHAFHRALRGRTHGGDHAGGTFWTWREVMYEIAGRLDPGNYHRLARAVFAEMALAGVTTVGEFHYVHHRPDGTGYDDPNAMGEALIAAAGDAGIRLTLLDTCYLAGGLANGEYLPLTPEQVRFGDGDATGWADRVRMLRDRPGVRIGAAIHSVRAVPADQLATVVAASAGRPLHIHLSEQPAENAECVAAHGISPTVLLSRAGALGPASTVVHATHLDPEDIAILGAAGVGASVCPTTERDLGDGIGPARELAAAGVPISVGSDQNAVVDLLAEAHAVEMNERLRLIARGIFTPGQLIGMLTRHDSLGWPDAGRIEVGARADLVEIDRSSTRTAGVDPAQIVFAATATDVRTVVVDGSVVISQGRHRLGDIGALLADAIAELTSPSTGQSRENTP